MDSLKIHNTEVKIHDYILEDLTNEMIEYKRSYLNYGHFKTGFSVCIVHFLFEMKDK